MAENNDLIQALLQLIQGGGTGGQPRNAQETFQALAEAAAGNQDEGGGGDDTGIQPPEEPTQFIPEQPDYQDLLNLTMPGYGGDRGFSSWAPPASPQGEQGFYGALGQIGASNVQAAARAYTEPISAFIREALSAKGAQDTRRVEGLEKRKTELGQSRIPVLDEEGNPTFDIDGNPITKLATGISKENPFGTGTLAAKAYAEMARLEKEAGVKTGEYDSKTGTFKGGTIDAETQAKLKLQEDQRKEIGQKGEQERLSLAEKARLSRQNMGHHQQLLNQQAQNIMRNIGQTQAPFASMFGLGGQGAGQGQGGQMAGPNNMNNMFAMAGQGQRQNLAHDLLGGQAQPFASTTAGVPQMVGGQNTILGLQGGMQAQQAAQLGANQQMGQLASKAGQGLYGQFNPQLANMYSMQRPFAQAAGQGIGAMGQAAGGTLAGIANVGAAI